MNDYIKRARQMRAQLDNITKDFTDEQAVANKELYQNWNGNGISLTAGTVVYYDEKLYRAIQPHTTQRDWTPDKTPALFVEISFDEYPEWKQPTGAHDAYAKGAKCSHNGKHWISDIDNNVYEPGVYGWTEV